MRLADVRFTKREGAVVAHLVGEIDLSNAAELRAAITAATPNDALGLLIDLTDVDYIDSTGIHLLYRLGDSLRTRGQALRLVIPRHSPVNDTLRLAGVKGHVDVVERVDEGLRALATSGA
jgi:anti-sigma B factor antagonist